MVYKQCSTDDTHVFKCISESIKGACFDPQPQPVIPYFFLNKWRFWYKKLSHVYKALCVKRNMRKNMWCYPTNQSEVFTTSKWDFNWLRTSFASLISSFHPVKIPPQYDFQFKSYEPDYLHVWNSKTNKGLKLTQLTYLWVFQEPKTTVPFINTEMRLLNF